MGLLRLAGRVVALIIGIIGSLVALIVTIITVISYHFDQLFDPSELLDSRRSHGFVGFLCFVVGFIGALLALLFPRASAFFMLVAGLVMLYVAGVWGVLPLIFLGLAALFAFLDRRHAERG